MFRYFIAVLCILLIIAGGWLYWSQALASRSQQANEVFVRVGDYSNPHLPVGDYAGHYLPYAMFALWAYDKVGGGRHRLNALSTLPVSTQVQAMTELVGGWMGDWTIIEDVDGPLSCPEGEGACGGRALGVLGYKVLSCHSRNEIVVAFRGTDFKNADDWISNFRWVTRFMQYYDHYEQVQRHIGPILDRALIKHGLPNPKIVATGHSLGGGLAQQAAYMDGRIREVYAFDPSTVTGYYDPAVNGEANAKGLKIDRVFQRGEILAYLRFFMTQLYPVAAFDPQTRTVRFNFEATGSMIDKHSMDDLTAGLLRDAGRPDQWIMHARPLPDAPGIARGEHWIYRAVAWVNGK